MIKFLVCYHTKFKEINKFGSLISIESWGVYRAMSTTISVGRLLARELWALRPRRMSQCPEELSARLHDLGLWSPCTFRQHRTLSSSCVLNCGCLPVSHDQRRRFVPYRGRRAGREVKSRDVNNQPVPATAQLDCIWSPSIMAIPGTDITPTMVVVSTSQFYGPASSPPVRPSASTYDV